MLTPIRLAKKLAVTLTVTALLGTGNLAFADEDTEATPEPTVIVEETTAPGQNEALETHATSEGTPDDVAPIPEAEPTTIQGNDEETSDAATDEEVTPEAETPDSDTEILNDETETEEPEDEAGASANVVPDPQFRACINKHLGYEKEQKRVVTAAQMKSLEYISCQGNAAKSLEGVQYATKAEGILVTLAAKADISALSKLSSTKTSKVTLVFRSGNLALGTFPNLSKLTNLSEVSFHKVTFKNYTNVTKIRKLKSVEIYGGNIQNISWIAKIPRLEGLYLQDTPVSDMTPVTGLKNLTTLRLEHNRIKVLPKPKVSMPNLSIFDVSQNQIRDFRNWSAWKSRNSDLWMTEWRTRQQQLFRIKPSFKGGNTEIDISSFYDVGGKRPTKAYLAEKEDSTNYRALTARSGTIVNGGKTARFPGKLAEGQFVWIENAKAGSYVIRVGDSKVRKIAISPSNTSGMLMVGDTLSLTATVTPADALNTKVTWKSSKPKVATVTSKGNQGAKNLANVKGVAKGTATITATAQDGSGVKASWTVTVLTKACNQSGKRTMYRMYNPISGEHLYTADAHERDTLARMMDWKYEGIAWVAPKTSSTPVYRLYNPGLGDHHYTTDKNEVTTLTKKHGWINEGIGWHSASCTKNVPVYRQFTFALRVGSHNYTADKNEYDTLNKTGVWRAEGIAWYAIRRR